VKKMFTPNPLAAKTIEANAMTIASEACSLFIKGQPEATTRAGFDIYQSWANHFQQRVLELSAAVAAGEPEVFSSRVVWSRQAMAARYIENVNLQESLKHLREVVATLLPPEDSSEALLCLDEAIQSYSQEVTKPEVSELDPAIPEQRLALFYMQAALEGNVIEAMQVVLDAIDGGLNPRTAITEVLLAAQREVGHLWHLDQITIAEEHLITSTTLRLMAVIAARSRRAPENGRTVVAASIAGNAHEVGIRAISYLMELDGWRVIYLGSDVPRNNLPAAIHFFDADLVMLSLTLSSQLSGLTDTIREIRATGDNPVSIMVGGNAFRDAPESWKVMGADGYADNPATTLELAMALTDEKPTSH
jgi:methanogenic corrinoid protein MtbC1